MGPFLTPFLFLFPAYKLRPLWKLGESITLSPAMPWSCAFREHTGKAERQGAKRLSWQFFIFCVTFSSDLAVCPLTQNNRRLKPFSFCQAISEPWSGGEEEVISMLMGTFPAVSKPFSPFLSFYHSFLASCLFLCLPTFTGCRSRALNPSAVVLQRYLSPLSLCLLRLSSFPLSRSLSLCRAWWMESLDCERHILSGVWRAIASCLTSLCIWVCVFCCCFVSSFS